MSDRIWIVTSAEPVYWEPMWVSLMRKHPAGISGVIMVPGLMPTGALNFIKEVKYYLSFFGLAGFLYFTYLYSKAKLSFWDSIGVECRRQQIPLYRVPALNDAANLLKENKAELVLSTVTKLVKEPVLAASEFGWVNTHCGLLPDCKGYNAPFWSLYHHEASIGVSVHLMDKTFDTGPLLLQKRIPNASAPYFKTLKALFQIAHDLHVELFCDWRAIIRKPMKNPQGGRYFGKPTAEDGRQFRLQGGRFV